MERFLNGLLSRLVRDLVGRGVDWAFDRATRRKGQPGEPSESTDAAATGEQAPVSEDLAEKARQLERMMRRIGH